MIVQWSVESGRGHFVVGTEPFELGTVPIGTRGCRFVVVRFTVDVRAAMAVSEDPVANKQKKNFSF